jgi:hypothetical protein
MAPPFPFGARPPRFAVLPVAPIAGPGSPVDGEHAEPTPKMKRAATRAEPTSQASPLGNLAAFIHHELYQ